MLAAEDPLLVTISSSRGIISRKSERLRDLLAAPVVWSRWKSAEQFDEHLTRIERSHLTLYDIRSVEQECSHELAQLGDLGVHPSAEVAIIRKEMKAIGIGTAASTTATAMVTATATANGGEGNDKSEKQQQAPVSDAAAAEDLQQQLELELRLVGRKLAILASRRTEEVEMRALAERRAAKARARDEGKNRDPMNFQNMGGRSPRF